MIQIRQFLLQKLIWFYFVGVSVSKESLQTEGVCTRDECQDIVNIHPSESIHSFKPDKMGFDEIYVINLKRRPEKKRILQKVFQKLKLNVKFWEAADGRELDHKYLEDLGIKMLPGYLDPYHNRPMTYGEIGCSLSHYFIWKDILAKGYSKALILEDDATFEPMFRRQWSRIFADVQEFVPNWDLVYLGRKILQEDSEHDVEGSDYLVWPHYSYWTVAYALTTRGAEKLVDQRPLKNLIPVDEYLSVMFDRNPSGEELWNRFFHPKNLVAVSIKPLLVNPAFYPENQGYVTDTENSTIIETDKY